jgi:hypothetical protein
MDEQTPLQETPATQAVGGTPPANYLVWAILTTIFCCLPLGIVSIVYAAQVNSKWQAGDLEGALKSSKNAKLWAWLSAGIGIAIAIIYIVVVVVLGVGSAIFSGVFGS